MKKSNPLKLGYDINLEQNSCKPTSIQFWCPETQFKKMKPEAPFKYMADAMVGVTAIKLNSYLKSPILNPQYNYEHVSKTWTELDPLNHIFTRSQQRFSNLKQPSNVEIKKVCHDFEQAFCKSFEAIQTPNGFGFEEVNTLIDTISWFEQKLKSPIIFNSHIQWSHGFQEKLLVFYSFLFHLRSVIAIDVNAHIEDPAHEAVKVDAITDYMAKADYIANDALLYIQFKKLATPWMTSHRAHVNGDPKVSQLFMEPMERAFQKYSHNAVKLVENLSPGFINNSNPIELEEALYLAQMDWLLGSDAGILFRLREELYGIQSGYETIFWQDVDSCIYEKNNKLSLCFELLPQNLQSFKAA